MIRELTEKYSHIIVELEALKWKSVEMESEKSENGGDLDRSYPKTQKRKEKMELQGDFRKIIPPTFDG